MFAVVVVCWLLVVIAFQPVLTLWLCFRVKHFVTCISFKINWSPSRPRHMACMWRTYKPLHSFQLCANAQIHTNSYTYLHICCHMPWQLLRITTVSCLPSCSPPAASFALVFNYSCKFANSHESKNRNKSTKIKCAYIVPNHTIPCNMRHMPISNAIIDTIYTIHII